MKQSSMIRAMRSSMSPKRPKNISGMKSTGETMYSSRADIQNMRNMFFTNLSTSTRMRRARQAFDT